jgi:hypothetical protein
MVRALEAATLRHDGGPKRKVLFEFAAQRPEDRYLVLLIHRLVVANSTINLL